MRVVFLLIGAICAVFCSGGAPACSASGPWTISLVSCAEDNGAGLLLEGQLPVLLPLTDHHWVEGQLHGQGRTWNLSDIQWHFEGNDSLQGLSLVYGGPHTTAQDPYRMLHRSRYGQDSLALFGRSGCHHAAVGWRIPARDHVSMNMAYLHRCGAALEYAVLGYRAPWQWVSDCYQSRRGVVGSGRWFLNGGNWVLQLASSIHLSHWDIAGYTGQRAVLGTAGSLQWETAAAAGEVEVLISPDGLHSPLGGNFPIPEDRVGIRGQKHVHGSGWTLGLDARTLTNYDGSRRYLRRWWELQWGEDPALELSLRRQPTPNFIAALRAGRHGWRFDHAQKQFRGKVAFPQAYLRFDAAADGRLRLEWRYMAGFQPHVIGKYNRVTADHDLYAAVSLSRGRWDLRLSVGTYDRGRLLRNWPQHRRWQVEVEYRF